MQCLSKHLAFLDSNILGDTRGFGASNSVKKMPAVLGRTSTRSSKAYLATELTMSRTSRKSRDGVRCFTKPVQDFNSE